MSINLNISEIAIITGDNKFKDLNEYIIGLWKKNFPDDFNKYSSIYKIPEKEEDIKKLINTAYNHHIERLMILSNIMLLSEIHPHEVHRWFMEMFVDSADWVMGPNVYGMGQFSDGGIFATKPYISGSNYVLKMSDYKKGDWCEVWDGLFWRFIGKHKTFFQKQPRLNFMVITLEKMDPQKRQYLLGRADDFLSQKTL